MTRELTNRLGPGLFGALALLCAVLPAAAQDYAVELLVFSRLAADDGEERWPLPTALPATEQALGIGEGGLQAAGGGRALQAIADNLRRSNGYRPLLHWRWIQPGWDRKQARPLHVQVPAGSALPLTQPSALASRTEMQRLRLLADPSAVTGAGLPLLDGTVSLSRSRFLHLAVDLIHVDPATGIPMQLRESRRMRSNELHYLDHPRFGVLVQVTPVN
ncbi:MAG: CsiV family protein [Gammaproteobacteria bacterium]